MKVISKIKGGLGNQMFQYACGRAIAHRLRANLYLDLSWFEGGNRVYMLDAFPNIRCSYAQTKKSLFQKIIALFERVTTPIRSIRETDYSYWPEIENVQSSVHLEGYWQNENYFSAISSIMKQEFQFPNFSCSEAEDIATKINASSCSVSIHIRRGDYVENPSVNLVHGVCSLEYYEKALQIIMDRFNMPLKLFLFSDDPNWVKGHFDTQRCPSVFVDVQQHKDTPIHDMHLMSLCQHHIIANSSFSWWAAWLSSNTSKGIVVAPKQWFAEETMKRHNPSRSSWITI